MVPRFYKFIAGLSLVLLFLAGNAVAQTQTEIVELYNRAVSSRKPTNEKITLLKEVVELAPNFLEARYALGATYFETQNFQKAIPHFEYVLARPNEVARKPTLSGILSRINLKALVAAAYNAVGSSYLEIGQPDSAISALKRAIELNAERSIFHYNLGTAYIKLAQYRDALSAYQRSLQLNPENALTWFNIGTAYWYLDEFGNAVGAYKKGLKFDPENRKALENLRKARHKILSRQLLVEIDSSLAVGNPDHALSLIRQLREIDPALAIVNKKMREAQRALSYNKAVDAIRSGRWTEALAMLKALPERFRDVATLKSELRNKIDSEREKRALNRRYDRALKLYRERSYSAAKQLIADILRETPNDIRARRLAALVDSAIVANRLTAQQKAEATQSAPAKTPALIPEARSAAQDSHQKRRESLSPADTLLASKSPLPLSVRKILPEKYANVSLHDLIRMGILLAAMFLTLAFAIRLLRRRRGRRIARRAQTAAQTMKRQRRAAKQEADDSAQVNAAVEKIDPQEEQSADMLEAGTEEFFERLVSDNGGVEILEIIEGEEKDREAAAAPAGEKADEKKTSDEEAFLALIDDQSLESGQFQEDDAATTAGTDDEATHTVDMSQFKVRKIGRYIVEKEIGRGAAGRIYKAWDPKLDRTVVIKTVSYSLTAGSEEIRRLKARVYREARAAAKLNHPNIVVVYDVEDEPTFSYIVMEHIEGPDLRELLLEESKIPAPRAVHFVSQVCKALQFAHAAGIVHRDIKPSNILILENDKIKVTDFGIAKVTNHLTLTQTGRVVGTPSYMAPEQIEGGDVDNRADIFSLGVVLYELLTGQRPFTGESLAALAYKIVHVEPTPPSLVNVELPDVYDDIVSRAIAKDPKDRYQTVTQLMDDLQKAKSKITS